MYGWCRKWKLLINVSKSNIIHFRKTGTKETNYMFKWGQVPLEKVNCYKYLGLYQWYLKNLKNSATSLCRFRQVAKETNYISPVQVGAGAIRKGKLLQVPGLLNVSDVHTAGRLLLQSPQYMFMTMGISQEIKSVQHHTCIIWTSLKQPDFYQNQQQEHWGLWYPSTNQRNLCITIHTLNFLTR